MRQSSTKSQATDKWTPTGQHTIFNDGQNPYNKATCKRLKSKWSELFINDNLIYSKTRKNENNEIDNSI